jgi:hypothetical protein
VLCVGRLSDRLFWTDDGQAKADERFRRSAATRTPLAKRLPIAGLLATSIAVAYLVGFLVSFWVGLAAYFVMLLLSVFFLRRVLGLRWGRILRYREPNEP